VQQHVGLFGGATQGWQCGGDLLRRSNELHGAINLRADARRGQSLPGADELNVVQNFERPSFQLVGRDWVFPPLEVEE
jgi:hypothetical protein